MPLKIGLIGCGAIAQIMHIPYLMDYEQFELVALADASESVLTAVADRYKIQRRYTDWRELMAQPDIEAVVLCHSGSHRDTILAALDAKKHVFTEKPITWGVGEAVEVMRRVFDTDRVVMVGYHKRYDPAFVYAQEQVQKMQDLGLVRITVLHPPNEMGLSPHRIRLGNGKVMDGHIDVVSWQQQVEGTLNGLAGGSVTAAVDEALGNRKDDLRLRAAYGILTVSVIHQVYMMYAFLGKPERVLHTEVWRDGLSIHTLLQYPNNVRCTIDWHFLSHVKDYREEYAFYGNHDRVILQFPSPYLKNAPSPVIVQGGDGELAWEKRVIVSYDEAFRNELLAFYESVVHGKVHRSPITEAVEHMTTLQHIIDAAK